MNAIRYTLKMTRQKIIFLVGPTAAGKTEVAAELAKKINAEIISCDSMQIYKGMDIGTQKPSTDLRKRIRHHMIDILEPSKEFSAADFRKRALRAIAAIHKKGKIPLFVGGTGLYVRVLIDGLFPSPPKNERLRKRLYRRKGLYGELKKVDPETARTVHPNDTKKIVRALEIYYTTKKTKSALMAATKPLTDKFDINIIGLTMPRDELYRRINERVDRMFEEAFLEEAKGLLKRKLSITAAQAIGYKEAWQYLKQENEGPKEIGELRELIKKNTRRYAKRQMTWFRADKRVEWVEVMENESPAQIVRRIAYSV